VIDVRREELVHVRADALMRSVGTDLEACTPVCRAVGDEAGDELLERMRRFGDLPIGGAIVTPAGRLDCAYVIHVVLRSPEEPVTVASVARAFQNGLRRAVEWQVETLAVPPLGTGAGNLDAELVAGVMFAVLREHEGQAYPRDVVIAVTTAYEEEAFRSARERPHPPKELAAAFGAFEERGDDWIEALERFVAESSTTEEDP
jgi:O-acetyl-ADP-ribose deacetylase (regulator of RNase III)